MRKHLTFIICLGLLLSANATFAQAPDVVLWGAVSGEGDFAGGLNGWTSNAISTGDDWVWEADATSNGAFGNGTIISPTASNGAMLFDADFMTTSVNPNPPQPYPIHEAELLSPIIDCSTMPTLSVKFNQVTRGLNGDTFFSYSTDGGVTFSIPINVNSDVDANVTSSNPNVKRFDMPNASGSSQVQLKFTADMDFYYWILDDVQLIEKPGNDLTLANGFVARATGYSMPQTSIDSIRFLADVANLGTNDQTNVVLSVEIIRDADGTVVFTANNNYGTMMTGDTVENQLFTDVYFPDTTLNSYTVTYTLSSDSVDIEPLNNTYTYKFEVVEDFFGKSSGFSSNVAPSANDAWSYGTSYFVKSGTDGMAEFPVTSVSFGASNPGDLAGEEVTILLEIPATGSIFDANDNNVIEKTERSVVAIGIYTFTGNEADDQVLEVPMIDFNTGGTYYLQANTNYSVVAKFAPISPTARFFMLCTRGAEFNYGAADYAAGLSGLERYGQLIDVGNSEDYSVFGFASIIPLIDLNFAQLLISTESVALTDNALTVFPNPATEFITASIELEEMTANAEIAIYNVSGQVMETRNLSNVQNEQVLFNLNGYTSGTYFMSIVTDAGHTIKRFIVSK